MTRQEFKEWVDNSSCLLNWEISEVLTLTIYELARLTGADIVSTLTTKDVYNV